MDIRAITYTPCRSPVLQAILPRPNPVRPEDRAPDMD